MSLNKKHVTFGSASEAMADYSDQNCWYSREELMQIRQEKTSLAKRAASPSDEIYLRGLDPHQEGVDHIHKRRMSFTRAVLAIQNEMQTMRVYDPKGLQVFASAHSSQDVKAARQRGKQDAADVNQPRGGAPKLNKKSYGSIKQFHPQHLREAAQSA